jgi:hypothetical protein
MLDFLNLIEKHMIVVEGLGEDKNLRKRMRTDDLMKELETLQKKCGKRGYAMDPSPEASPITRRDTPTLAVLTATAVERIHLTNEKEVLKTYKGKTRSYHQETLGDEDMKLNNVHVAKKS